MSGRVAPRTTLTFGTRVDRFDRLDATRVGPRAGVELQVSQAVRVGVSGGRYFQQPELLAIVAYPQNARLTPIEADHGVVGVYYQPRADLKFSAETFVKRYRKYPVSTEYPVLTLANTGLGYGGNDLLLPFESRGRGRSRGLELFMRKTLRGSVYGQAAYTFSQTEHAAGDEVFRRGLYDTPHVLTVLGGKRLERWEFSGRFTYATGRPFTPPLMPQSLDQNRWIYDLSRMHAERLPAFHRLDLRVDRRFRPGRTQIDLFLEVQNVYNGNSVIEYGWNPKTRTIHGYEQLGLLPLVGINVEF